MNAGVPARWVTGDEVYGADPVLRAECEFLQVGYVLAIGCDRRVPTGAGCCEPTCSLPGCHGTPGSWWLLVRSHRDTGELAYYRCYSPHPVPMHELVRVAGRA